MPSGPIEPEIPQPFPCLLETTMQVHERCFSSDEISKDYVKKFGGQLTRCHRGYGWDEAQHSCFKCPINTQVRGCKTRKRPSVDRCKNALSC